MERILTMDLHTHPLEKKIKPEDFWKRIQDIGLNAVAATEHAEFNPKKAFERVETTKPDNVLLLPGIELNTEFGHCMIYYHNKELYEVKELLEIGIKIEKVLEIAKANGFTLSVAHPWGFDYDSMAYLMGAAELEDLVINEHIGVEAYNGMIGELSDFIYESRWVKKPINFLDFLQKNRVSRRVGITRLTGKIKTKLDAKRLEVVSRAASAIDLGEKADFITAGSDAHSASRIGTGILKIKTSQEKLDNKILLQEIQQKDRVIWSGPLVKETQHGVYEKIDEPLRGKEMIQGLRYATKKIIGKKSIKERIKEKIRKRKKTRVN